MGICLQHNAEDNNWKQTAKTFNKPDMVETINGLATG